MLKARITEDMKTAMRAKDTARLSAIRLLLAAMKQREVDERIELSDADVLDLGAAEGPEQDVRQRRVAGGAGNGNLINDRGGRGGSPL